jgi:ketosteroid isomerase-like protein
MIDLRCETTSASAVRGLAVSEEEPMASKPQAIGSSDERATARAWYQDFYAGVDAMDVTVFDRACTPDTRVQLANHDVVVGREAVKRALGEFWSTISGMEHTFRNVIEVGDETLLEADVRYTRLDGSAVVVRVATVIERRDGLVHEQRIYADLGPLHADAPSV